MQHQAELPDESFCKTGATKEPFDGSILNGQRRLERCFTANSPLGVVADSKVESFERRNGLDLADPNSVAGSLVEAGARGVARISREDGQTQGFNLR